MTTALDRDYLTVAETAELLRVDRSTVRRWIRDGSLPAYRVGHRFVRVKRSDLAQVIAPANARQEQTEPRLEPSQDAGTGLRYVTSVDQIRPLTPEERKRALEAVERARELRQELLEKYGEFHPPSWELLNEARRERTEQLP